MQEVQQAFAIQSQCCILGPRYSQQTSDAEQCWNRCRDVLVTCPFEAVDDKNILFCDPFGPERFATAREAIDEMKLEYLGREEFEGRTCHRVRSWTGEVSRVE
jgi:hypothetical protein